MVFRIAATRKARWRRYVWIAFVEEECFEQLTCTLHRDYKS